ncbi:1,4-dihydroxy-2-naphthoate octaprenyltransferase [Tenacibaculum todarodis]|uniref:1,4-dihydroxy-2-naphthoate octaprenyltransferase n=1 Tax=Tenacibaculum todarodis TaxID=1850252 RepID=A0A1L3JII3_9FLAO|nr:1,4-dihydroxy-2-naphthoate octaprenyltransferase [Tenacibaculum todarodis]APG64929.1 1,4-dihydroxy-2-naphthoate octaprenyltransferase [Tenacibaculum todarodis]
MLKNYIKAARLRTLPLSVSGIITGAFLANFLTSGEKNYAIFFLAILTTIGFQVLSNFANDYGDGIKGTDDNREGEVRMVSSGAITPKQMKRAMVVTAVLSLFVALLLIFVSFGKENFGYSVLFFVLGIASIVAAIKYTVGNSAYGYSGFGDVFVFIFFGVVATVGTYFLYTKQLNYEIFLPAISVGLLSTAVLNLNNMRDRINDAKVGKNTLVVKIGSQKAKTYHYFLIVGALVSAVIYTFLNYKSPLQFLFLIAFIPLILNMITVGKNIIHSELDSELKKVALSTFLFAILFGLGQVM